MNGAVFDASAGTVQSHRPGAAAWVECVWMLLITSTLQYSTVLFLLLNALMQRCKRVTFFFSIVYDNVYNKNH